MLFMAEEGQGFGVCAEVLVRRLPEGRGSAREKERSVFAQVAPSQAESLSLSQIWDARTLFEPILALLSGSEQRNVCSWMEVVE